VKTHYELLGLVPTADSDAIKKAFRREIARYHPDKVVHLGAEFQQMAESRAAELTVAYKTLSDPALRAEYDATIASGVPAPAAPVQPPPRPVANPMPTPAGAADEGPRFRPPTLDEIKTPPPPPTRAKSGRFAAERADRDNILRRAIGARIQATVQDLYGTLDRPTVRGFDFALVPTAKPRFLGSPPPRVLVKVVDVANAAALTEAWTAASRANVHSGRSPVIVLVFSSDIAAPAELSRAWETMARQRKTAAGPDDVTVMVCDVADWSCRLPPNVSAVVRKLADRISA
jgi:hypothetical protein